MALGKPAVSVPRDLTPRDVLQQIANIRERLTQLDAAVTLLQSGATTGTTTAAASSDNSAAALARSFANASRGLLAKVAASTVAGRTIEVPAEFDAQNLDGVSGNPTLDWAAQAPSLFFASPIGYDGRPEFRALDLSDIPPGAEGEVLTTTGGAVAWGAAGATFAVPIYIGCRAYNDGTQSLPDNTETALTFNAEDWDPLDLHSTSADTSRFTCPTGRAGWWQVTYQALFAASASGDHMLWLRKNGGSSSNDVIGSMQRVPTPGPKAHVVGGSCAVALNAGDYIECMALQDSGGALNVGSSIASSRAAAAALEFRYLGPFQYTGDEAALDFYTAGLWGAFAIARLLSSYFGPALRVRRSSDNAEEDISFLSTGALDTSALLAFAGAGSAYVVRWYDQTGNGNHLSQSTTANQPLIVSSGSYLGLIRFDGTNDSLATPAFNVTTAELTTVHRGVLRSALASGETKPILVLGANWYGGARYMQAAYYNSPTDVGPFYGLASGGGVESWWLKHTSDYTVEATTVARIDRNDGSSSTSKILVYRDGTPVAYTYGSGAGNPTGNFQTGQAWNLAGPYDSAWWADLDTKALVIYSTRLAEGDALSVSTAIQEL